MAEPLTRVRQRLRPAMGRHLATFASLSAATQVEAVLSMLSAVVLVRAAGAHSAGEVFIAQAVAGVWFMVLDPRLEDAAQRYVPLCRAAGDGQATVLFHRLLGLDRTVGLGAAALGAGLVVILGHSGGSFAGAPPEFVVLAVVAAGVGSASGTANAGFALAGRLRHLGLVRLVVAGATFLLVTSATIAAGPLGFLVAAAVSRLVATGAVVILALRAVRAVFGPPAASRPPLPAGLVAFAAKSSVATSAGMGAEGGVLALAGVLGGPTLVTFLKIACAPGRLLTSVVSPVSTQLYPQLAAAAAAGDVSAMRRHVVQLTAVLSGIGVVAVAVVQMCVGTALGAVYGPAYAPLAASAVVLFAAACIRGAVVWSRVLPLALGRPGTRLVFAVIDSVLLVLMLVVAVRYADGPVGTTLGFGWGSVVVAAAGAVTWLILARSLNPDR